MQNADQNVSTAAQRQALEAMSNELVRKLNLMIQEQEQRARDFAATHHSTLPTPAAPVLNMPAPKPQAKAPAPVYTPVTPPQPVTTKEPQASPKREQPTRYSAPPPGAKKTKPQEEEGNIGMGIVIFSLIGIIMLIRSCT